MTNDGHAVSLCFDLAQHHEPAEWSNHKGEVLSGLMNQAPTTDSPDLQTDTVGVAFMRPELYCLTIIPLLQRQTKDSPFYKGGLA
jgi:hypothetical protein